MIRNSVMIDFLINFMNSSICCTSILTLISGILLSVRLYDKPKASRLNCRLYLFSLLDLAAQHIARFRPTWKRNPHTCVRLNNIQRLANFIDRSADSQQFTSHLRPDQLDLFPRKETISPFYQRGAVRADLQDQTEKIVSTPIEGIT